MHLNAALFERVIQSLRSDERNSKRHENRREGRVGIRCQVELTPKLFDDSGQKTVRVTVRDLSASGIGFVSNVAMAVGTELD
jgi:c-di-GMP-binding flagellar brake protein YcgR